ncbi:hypothetical protein [Henriciella litoralis]|uniref:hypothetical protein n=1 Tax=Henriciella litoralis TaxID=568102 RepID=UPI000A066D32|nr:hypothetical protein [Henriciella litoralis]
MGWQSYTFFLKFIAIVVSATIIGLGLVVLFGDPLNAKADSLRGDAVYDGVVSLISVFGKTGTGIGICLTGLVIGVLCYRAAER